MKVTIDRKQNDLIPEDLLDAAERSKESQGLMIYPATGPYSDNLLMFFRNGQHCFTFNVRSDGSMSLANPEPVTGPDKLGTIRPYKITGPTFETLTIS